VDEHDGLAGSAREVPDRADPHFMKFRENPFGVHLPAGIFFVVMEAFVGRAD
jgi:hypothetical protein